MFCMEMHLRQFFGGCLGMSIKAFRFRYISLDSLENSNITIYRKVGISIEERINAGSTNR